MRLWWFYTAISLFLANSALGSSSSCFFEEMNMGEGEERINLGYLCLDDLEQGVLKVFEEQSDKRSALEECSQICGEFPTQRIVSVEESGLDD